MYKRNIKSFVCGFLVCLMLISSVGVFADTVVKAVTKTVKIVLNSYLVKIDGKPLAGDSIVYNGKNYVDLQQVATLLGKDYKWDEQTKTLKLTEKPKPVIQNTTPTAPIPVARRAPVSISKSQFAEVDNVMFYVVTFTDGFNIALSSKNEILNSTYEDVMLTINVDNYKDKTLLKPLTITGYDKNNISSYKPTSFSEYKNYIPLELQQTYKQLDFMDTYNSLENMSNMLGMLFFNSSSNLDSIYYDDGVHQCNLLFVNQSLQQLI
jgi:hypothetical protein